jgi:hypothetical protein
VLNCHSNLFFYPVARSFAARSDGDVVFLKIPCILLWSEIFEISARMLTT